jgi:hypothetical protein
MREGLSDMGSNKRNKPADNFVYPLQTLVVIGGISDESGFNEVCDKFDSFHFTFFRISRQVTSYPFKYFVSENPRGSTFLVQWKMTFRSVTMKMLLQDIFMDPTHIYRMLAKSD